MFVKSKDGVRIYYELIRNDKKSFLVFLHGLASSSKSFKNQIDYLKKYYSIIAIDFRGHGQSDKPKGSEYYTIQHSINDIKSVLSKENVKSYSVIGFSLGGGVALRLAQKDNRVNHIIVINPAFGRESVRPSFLLKLFAAKFVPRFLIKLFTTSEDESKFYGLLDVYGKHLLHTPRYVYETIIKTDESADSIKLKKKFTIIKSDNDEILNYYVPKNLNYDLMTISGHHYVLPENPKELNSAILYALGK
ncbi:2-succinyl-6-hydroxy-2,4-cyclohexadiene-1-carboxylate synthase [Candidatus Tiddalikarchaeum anstoanum]|nr:2-succinyl-6-hydroxy-2,4-cyclohexadiene-1-carboxylate synthase [Candidatus Tiddalikarchaeum anstoanum]